MEEAYYQDNAQEEQQGEESMEEESDLCFHTNL